MQYCAPIICFDNSVARLPVSKVAKQYMLKILGNTLNYNVLSFWDKFVHIKLYYQACEINPYIKQARNDKLVCKHGGS